MKQRLKGLIAIIVTLILVCKLFGMENFVALAEDIYVYVDGDITVSEDSSDNYIFFSGGEKKLIIESGVTVSGNIDFSEATSDGTDNILDNQGTITGNVNTGDNGVNIVINNYGTIDSQISASSGTIINNTGNLGDVIISGGSLVMTAGQAGAIAVSSEVDSTPLSLGNCSVTSVNTSGNVVLSGTVNVDSLSANTLTGSGTLNVTSSLTLSEGNDDITFNVESDTEISVDNTITVNCDGKEFTLNGADGSLRELEGMTFSVENPSDSNVNVAADEITGQKYWYGEVSGTVTLTAADGYYFPDDYESGIANTGNGNLNIQRVSTTVLTLTYEFSTTDTGDVTISVVAAEEEPKEPGTASIIISDVVYGETIEPQLSSSDYDVDLATVEYKEKDAGDSAYTVEVPTEVGEYTARATFPENDQFAETTVECNFAITELESDEGIEATTEDAESDGAEDTEEATTEDAGNGEAEDTEEATTEATTEDTGNGEVEDTEEDTTEETTTEATTEDTENGEVDDTEEDTTEATTEDAEDAEAEDTEDATTEDAEDAETDDAVEDTTDSVVGDTIDAATSTQKKSGAASISVEDVEYGNIPSPVLGSANYDVSLASVEYKKKGADDSMYSQAVPTEVGEYTVRAIFPENDEYAECHVESNFIIKYHTVDKTLYTLSGIMGENGFYTSKVKVTAAEGYLISDTLNGNYVSFLEFDSSRNAGNIFFMDKNTGAKTAGVELNTLSIDTNAPNIDAIDGNTYYAVSKEINISDKNLSSVIVNGKEISFENGNAKIELDSNNGVTIYTIECKDLAGNENKITISVAAEWTKSGIIPGGTIVTLSAGNAYKLGAGSWKVEGDSTTYAGNTEFYVETEGQYTFIKQ